MAESEAPNPLHERDPESGEAEGTDDIPFEDRISSVYDGETKTKVKTLDELELERKAALDKHFGLFRGFTRGLWIQFHQLSFTFTFILLTLFIVACASSNSISTVFFVIMYLIYIYSNSLHLRPWERWEVPNPESEFRLLQRRHSSNPLSQIN